MKVRSWYGSAQARIRASSQSALLGMPASSVERRNFHIPLTTQIQAGPRFCTIIKIRAAELVPKSIRWCREFEKASARKETYEKLKSAADEATDVLEDLCHCRGRFRLSLKAD
jgi:hypothetical protein